MVYRLRVFYYIIIKCKFNKVYLVRFCYIL